jgi:hypothetical protein
MPAFLIASRKLPPPLPPWQQQQHGKQHDAAAEAAVAAAAATLPGKLVVPERVLLQRRSGAALEQLSPVDDDMRDAVAHMVETGNSFQGAAIILGFAR